MGDPTPALLLIGCSHHSAPLELRERLTLDEGRETALYRELAAEQSLEECFILHTCNRVEVYGVGFNGAANVLRARLAAVTGTEPEHLAHHGYERTGVGAIEHLYEVAAGLNSQLIGETEIFGQLKNAYACAQRHQAIGARLHRILQKSFQAGKWARTHTAIAQGQVSLGNVAVELAERVFGDLRPARALVVGSGDIGCDVAKALRSRGLGHLQLTNRSNDRATELAAEVGASPLPFAQWKDALDDSDVVIFATSAPYPLLDVAAARLARQRRRNRPLFLIDLAVPRDVEAAVGKLDDFYLYNLEELTEIANANRALRESEVEKCRAALRERAEALEARLLEG